MKNWTVRLRIQFGFAVIIAIMIIMSMISFERMTKIESSTESMMNDALQGMHHLTEIRATWTDLYLESVDFLLVNSTGKLDSQTAAALNKAEAQLQRSLVDYQGTVTLQQDQLLLNSYIADVAEFQKAREAALGLYQQGQVEEARAAMSGPVRELWLKGRADLGQIIALNQDLAREESATILSTLVKAEIILVVAMILAVLAAIACGYSLLKAITRPVEQVAQSLRVLSTGDLSQVMDLKRKDEFAAIEQDFNHMSDEIRQLVAQAQRSAVQVTTSVTEIAATSKQQQATATETAATTTEIGATSREIAATSRDLVRTMTEVSDTAEQTSVLAGSGQLGLARMEDTMHQVMSAAELVNAKLGILNEKAGNINQVVTTIVKVADQTNLLSLNAAIEAEKAGEYGRGFAVVATEVRRLADQTAVATYDIEQMVREIQSAVSAGVMGMDKFSEEVRRGIGEVGQVGEQLSQIIQQVQALAPRVQMVNEGMQAQATGAEQINLALAQLGEATGQTVDSLRQTSAAIDEMNQVANGLRSSVTRFKV